MPDDSTRVVHERNQAALVNFLREDLNLAFAFLATARIDISDDPKHSRALLEKVRIALRTKLRHGLCPVGEAVSPPAWAAWIELMRTPLILQPEFAQ